jgi:hypothetical protein
MAADTRRTLSTSSTTLDRTHQQLREGEEFAWINEGRPSPDLDK